MIHQAHLKTPSVSTLTPTIKQHDYIPHVLRESGNNSSNRGRVQPAQGRFQYRLNKTIVNSARGAHGSKDVDDKRRTVQNHAEYADNTIYTKIAAYTLINTREKPTTRD